MTYNIDYMREVGLSDVWIAAVTFAHSNRGLETTSELILRSQDEVVLLIDILKTYSTNVNHGYDMCQYAVDFIAGFSPEQHREHGELLKMLETELFPHDVYSQNAESPALINKVNIRYYDKMGTAHHMLCDGNQELMSMFRKQMPASPSPI